MDFNNTKITMKDGKEYLVIEQVNHEGHTYLLLVNNSDNTDSLFVEVKGKDILKIDSKEFTDVVLPLFANKITNN